MRSETLRRAITEARRFIELAEAVPLRDYGSKGKPVQFVESGKASGAVRRASMDLTRILADLRQGR